MYHAKNVSVSMPINLLIQQVKEHLNPEFQFRDVFAEAIVHSMEDSGKLDALYAALHGVRPYLGVSIFDQVELKPHMGVYYWTENRELENVTLATVIDVNPYATESVHIEFDSHDGNKNPIRERKWVKAEVIKDVADVPDWFPSDHELPY